jgi:hypothetical protein
VPPRVYLNGKDDDELACAYLHVATPPDGGAPDGG